MQPNPEFLKEVTLVIEPYLRLHVLPFALQQMYQCDPVLQVEARFADKGVPLVVGCKSGKRSGGQL